MVEMIRLEQTCQKKMLLQHLPEATIQLENKTTKHFNQNEETEINEFDRRNELSPLLDRGEPLKIIHRVIFLFLNLDFKKMDVHSGDNLSTEGVMRRKREKEKDENDSFFPLISVND